MIHVMQSLGEDAHWNIQVIMGAEMREESDSPLCLGLGRSGNPGESLASPPMTHRKSQGVKSIECACR